MPTARLLSRRRATRPAASAAWVSAEPELGSATRERWLAEGKSSVDVQPKGVDGREMGTA